MRKLSLEDINMYVWKLVVCTWVSVKEVRINYNLKIKSEKYNFQKIFFLKHMVQRTVNKTISYELTIATQKMGCKPRRQGSTGFQVKIDVIAGSTGR